MTTPVYESKHTVTFHLDEKTKQARLNSFIDWVYEDIGDSLGEFFATQREGFYDNKVTGEYCLNNNGDIIPLGMKLGKAVGRYFSDEYTEEDIYRVQTEASRLIQENMITGKLCISVHPLDFLSSSENNHSWRSCHALDGEYRAGNLSYMLDDCTVIAYLKSDKPDCSLPRFPEDVPWNDKKWRCLFHFDFDRGIVWAGRQYPFSSESALDMVNTMFGSLGFFSGCHTNPFESWTCNVVKGDISIVNHERNIESYLREAYVIGRGHAFPISKFIAKGEDSLNFNDLLDSSFYTPKKYTFYVCGDRTYEKAPPLKIGKKVPCVHCGENKIFPNGTMLCEKCMLEYTNIENEDVGYCHHCGRHIVFNIEHSYRNDYYCDECYNEHFGACERCGYVIPYGRLHMDDDGRMVCASCLEAGKEEVDFFPTSNDVLPWEPF